MSGPGTSLEDRDVVDKDSALIKLVFKTAI